MLAVQGVSKSYGLTRVLDNVSLNVPDGTVHALLGANGAGKSTLMRCIAGAVPTDDGTILIAGESHLHLTPQSSSRLGVASVFQHLSLVPTLSVAENICLGVEPRRLRFFNDRRRQTQQAVDVLAVLGEDIDPSTRVEDLPADRKQMVEIAKALAKSPSVLILDEPTAALSRSETDRLFSVIRELKRSGISIIYISHRIPEVFEIADTMTVLRDGSVVLQGEVAAATVDEIVRAIVGDEPQRTKTKTSRSGGSNPVLAVTDLICGLPDPISLLIRPGEIVGVYGLKGSGREAVVAALAGAIPTRGKIFVNGVEQRFAHPADAISNGVCLIPGDRHRRGLFSTMSSFDNVLLPHMGRLGSSLFRAGTKERKVFASVARSLGVVPPDPRAMSLNLSGGNQQKLLLGRWISRPSAINALLLEEPTEGVDAGAREDLYDNLRSALREHRFGILWSSSDLDELVEMSDRLLVMAAGRVVKELVDGEVTQERILSAAQQV